MSKPGTLAILKHGVLLCGKTFKTFVETFNWLVDCLRNIQGDYDISPSTGHIQVTGVSDGRPVIRYVGEAEGSEPDGVSIVKGEDDGVLSVAGFAAAAADTVPVKTSGGAVEWKEAAGGKVTGNAADSVEISLSGAVFRSADDSNVQIKTYMDGETPVIQIGVYYK